MINVSILVVKGVLENKRVLFFINIFDQALFKIQGTYKEYGNYFILMFTLL